MGKLRHRVIKSKAMQQIRDPAEISTLEVLAVWPMLHPHDSTASQNKHPESMTVQQESHQLDNGLFTLLASTHGAGQRGGQDVVSKAFFSDVSTARLQTSPTPVTFLRQVSAGVSSRTSSCSQDIRGAPHKQQTKYFDSLCVEQNLSQSDTAPTALHNLRWSLVNAVKTLRLVKHSWSPAVQHTPNLLAAWGGTRWASKGFQPVQAHEHWILCLLLSFPMQDKWSVKSYQAWPRFVHLDWACASLPFLKWLRKVASDTSSREARNFVRWHLAE